VKDVLPIEFSLEHSLHLETMLACPRPPFKGLLSYCEKLK